MSKALDDLIKDVNKQQKEEIMSYGLMSFNYERIPFTSPRMNYCTYGGIPKYKITELFGEEHGGKTTTALDLVANYQHMGKPDGDVVWVDAENTLDVEWAQKIGVDVDDMYIVQPKSQSAEELFNIIEKAVVTGETGLWVLDSVGVLLSAQEWEKTVEDKTYGGVSKPLTLFCKRIEQYMMKYKATGIVINQMRENMGSMYGGTQTVGGRGLKHIAAVRLEFKRGEFIDEKGNHLPTTAENPAGNKVLMSMKKNKTCPPNRRTGFYTINYLTGVDYLMDLVDVAIKYNIIDKHGAWFDIIDPSTGEILEGKIQGQANVYTKLEEDSSLLEKVENLVNEYMK